MLAFLVCTWVIFKVYALYSFSAFTINKVCWKEDRCSAHYVISLDHTGPVLTLRPPKNLTCQPRKRDKEDTESITTPISPYNVSHPNTYHITDSLSPHWHHLHFRFQLKPLLWVVSYSYTYVPVAVFKLKTLSFVPVSVNTTYVKHF